MRIGVFGGSFDPVHRGHLSVATQAADRLGLDEVLFVPARIQPLKPGGHHAGAHHRLAMLRAATAPNPRFRVDPREIERDGPSYTIDTLRELKLEHPADELFLVVGSDAARDLPRWREGSEIGKLATLVVVPRPGVAETAPGMTMLQIEPVDISATAVRRAAGRGEPLANLVPADVASYIVAHGLYQRESDA